jgi:hypothetical protein
VAGSCECGEEPSGSGATELVSCQLSVYKHKVHLVLCINIFYCCGLMKRLWRFLGGR